MSLYQSGASSYFARPECWQLTWKKENETEPQPHQRGSRSESSALPLISASLVPQQLLRTGMLPIKPPPPPPGYVVALPFSMEDTPKNRALSLKLTKAWKDVKRAANAMWTVGLKPLQQENGSYDWILNNEVEPRMRRLAEACSSMMQVQSLVLGQDSWHSRSYLKHKWKRSQDSNQHPPRITSSAESALDKALRARKDGLRACALVFATKDEDLGGGFMAGYAGNAIAELCMRSDLYDYLRNASLQAKRQNRNMIAEDGTLFMEDVHVFRYGAELGFKPLGRLVEVQVAVVELQNLNPYSASAKQQLVIAKFDHDRYAELLEQKFIISLQTAMEAGTELITISDETCLKLYNSIKVFGTALGRALAKIRNIISIQFKFPTIVLCGTSDFVVHVRNAYREIGD